MIPYPPVYPNPGVVATPPPDGGGVARRHGRGLTRGRRQKTTQDGRKLLARAAVGAAALDVRSLGY